MLTFVPATFTFVLRKMFGRDSQIVTISLGKQHHLKPGNVRHINMTPPTKRSGRWHSEIVP